MSDQLTYCEVVELAEKVREWCANPPWLPDLDDQQIIDFSLNGTDLTITLEDGGTQTVDLMSLLDNTDDQQITDFSLNGSVLTITLEDGGTETVDLSTLIIDEVEIETITCAQARTLGNAGNLVPGQHYLVTDYNRGTVGPAQILTHAVTANNLSWNVSVQTAFDDSAWHGRWDPDTCRIVDLYDNRGNNIKSDNGDEVERFPWGNPLVTGNEFNDYGFVYTGGTVRDNTGNPTGYLQIAGGSVTNSDFGASSDVRMTGGSIANATIDEGRLILDGTGRFDNSHLAGGSFVDTDSIEIRNSRFNTTSIFYGDGGTGRVDRLSSDRGYIDLRNAQDADLDDVNIEAYGRVFANGAGRIRLQYVNIGTLAYAQVTAAGDLIMRNSDLSSSSLVQVTAGALDVRNTSLSDIARIQHLSTGTNEVFNSTFDSYGRAIFQDSATGNQVNYSRADSLGLIRFRGTSAGNTVQRSRASTQAYFDFVNTDNSRVWYTAADATGYAIMNDCDGLIVQRCEFAGYGRLRADDSSGFVRGVNVEGTAYVWLRNNSGDLRYSSFDSYFYYYLTGNTTVKQGLDGSGRQTYTEPNPTTIVTGPGVRNW